MPAGTLSAVERADVFGGLLDQSGSALFDSADSPLQTGEFGSVTTGLSVGSMVAVEVGIDTLDASGRAANRFGSMLANETGSDTFLASALQNRSGALGAFELGIESFNGTGAVVVSGRLQAADGVDSFGGGGKSQVTGSLQATEAWTDYAAITGNAAQPKVMFPLLPAGPDSSKYNIEIEDVAMRTELEGGYVATRPRHTRIPRRTWTVGYTMIPDADKQSLLAFYVLVRGGSQIFDWYNDEDGQVYQVRFLDKLQLAYKGYGPTKLWDVTIRLQQA